MRHELVTAGETGGRGFRDLLAGGQQCVDAPEQTLALGAAGRVAEPLRREEGRGGEHRRVAQREVREARQSRLEAVHDVEPAAGEREREAGADSDRHAHPAAPGDRHRRPDRNRLRRLVERAEQRTSSGCEIASAVGGSEDGDRVTAAPELAREYVHVLVHVVRLRPSERRDERDPHGDRV